MLKDKNSIFKPVIKAKDMDEDMFKNIEHWAKETFEDSRVKYKDEKVIINICNIKGNSKLY